MRQSVQSFRLLGEVHHDLTLPEALEAYEKIPAERMNGLKSVGLPAGRE